MHCWRKDSEFEPWLRPIMGNTWQVHCSVCKKTICSSSIGINALRSLVHSVTHKSAMRCIKSLAVATMSVLHYYPGPQLKLIQRPPLLLRRCSVVSRHNEKTPLSQFQQNNWIEEHALNLVYWSFWSFSYSFMYYHYPSSKSIQVLHEWIHKTGFRFQF